MIDNLGQIWLLYELIYPSTLAADRQMIYGREADLRCGCELTLGRLQKQTFYKPLGLKLV